MNREEERIKRGNEWKKDVKKIKGTRKMGHENEIVKLKEQRRGKKLKEKKKSEEEKVTVEVEFPLDL